MKLSPQDLDRLHSEALDQLGIMSSGTLAPVSVSGTATPTVSNFGPGGRRWRSHRKHHGFPVSLDVVEHNGGWE